jgi:CHAD domain-containing protein
VPTTTTEGSPGPIAFVVHARLVELVDRIALGDSAVRRHKSSGVHQMRVTLRRLRSILVSFAPLYDETAVASLRGEVKWLAGELGGARDAEVVRQRLVEMAATDEQRAVAARVDVELAEAQATGVERAVAALDSKRYSEMVQELADFAGAPPWFEEACRPETEVPRQRVLREWKRLRRRVHRADETEGAVLRREALHEARKAAKRLRYAAETLKPAYGQDAARLARRAKGLQEALGDIQDHAVARETLRVLAEKPGRDAHDAFVLGTFHADEDPHWAEAEERYADAWATIARKKNRSWLT